VINIGKTFIIADLRLFNEVIANQMGYADFESMNSEVIRSWNSGVKPDDDVIIMGDIGDASVE
jgi:calcineurin-like phosphoesterase family protein